MSIGSMVRSGITDHTAGYGNTRTGVALTTDFLSDNEICEGRIINGRPDPSQPDSMVSRIYRVLGMKDPERETALNELRAAWLAPHSDGGISRKLADARFFSMMTTLSRGREFGRVVDGCRKAA